ncbi:lactonase family protein [Allorhodopirellula solitaria]|uniref:6-phosphogluconolactonase n=1 Tax=Allorhodopirellula solitaria TaxID=2527987 RepID=A0A5C5WZ68_9BACT|nr:lactonase family protein [Allorhodopirellula solitaria]TWT55918.1 6-phosphogluconolactonase [Allorhodopirellula solitaria]
MIRIRSLAFVPAVCFPLVASLASAETVDVWFGTTTPRRGESRGIYHSSFDTETGKLTRPTLAAQCDGPGFLELHPDGKTLYATGKPGSADGPRDAVSAFRVSGDAGTRELEFIAAAGTGDGGAAHVSTDHAGKVLLSAQYGGGSTSLYRLAADGSIGALAEVKEHADLLPKVGSGVVEGRQNASHAHWTGTSPDDRFAFVPDLGMDRVVIWKLDADKPSLTHHGFGVCPPGGGPRHMKFGTDGSKIYVLNELALSITVFDYDTEKGEMTPVQTIPTLSDEIKAKENFNSASEIRVHPSGRFVYAANRGHDSISVFQVDDTGKLEAVEVESIRGGWPRNFNIDPSGKWLIAAGRDSNTATVFAIDAETGELTFTRQTQSVPTPICVLFAK